MSKRVAIVGIQLRDRETFGDGLNAMKVEKGPLRIAKKMKERAVERIRQEWVDVTGEIKEQRVWEKERLNAAISFPVVHPSSSTDPSIATSITPAGTKEQSLILASPPKKKHSPAKKFQTPSPIKRVTVAESEEERPLVIPASPVAEPMDESPPPKSPLFRACQPQSMEPALPIMPPVMHFFPQQPQPPLLPPVQPQSQASLQGRRKVRVNRTRRREDSEGVGAGALPVLEEQRRQTFADFGQRETTPAFHHNELRLSVPSFPLGSPQNPFGDAGNGPAVAHFQGGAIFQQPAVATMAQPTAPIFNPVPAPTTQPAFVAPQGPETDGGFSMGRQGTPVKRPTYKTRRRNIRR